MDIMSAPADANANFDSYDCDCSGGTCCECYNAYTLILVWYLETPEFHFLGIIVSAPVASLAALWGMTSVTSTSLNFQSLYLCAET
jgi:hypothetical protein